MIELKEIFDIYNGLASSQLDILEYKPNKSYIDYIRPASKMGRTTAGYIQRDSIDNKYVFPINTIFVSTNGEGSHSYTYVSQFEFVPNSDVSVLIPKEDMTIQEKLFYAHCITMNRYKFNYGRKPKGKRLRAIKLPTRDKIPNWVNKTQLLDYSSIKKSKIKETVLEPLMDDYIELEDIFNIDYGHSLELNKLTKIDNGINFVSRTAKNNGVSAKVNTLNNITTEKEISITVSLGGSVLEAFLQIEPYYTGYHISILKPKEEMTKEELLYYCVCIRANKYRYSYGRQANRTLKNIIVPNIFKSKEDRIKVNNYIKSLAYSFGI